MKVFKTLKPGMKFGDSTSEKEIISIDQMRITYKFVTDPPDKQPYTSPLKAFIMWTKEHDKKTYEMFDIPDDVVLNIPGCSDDDMRSIITATFPVRSS